MEKFYYMKNEPERDGASPSSTNSIHRQRSTNFLRGMIESPVEEIEMTPSSTSSSEQFDFSESNSNVPSSSNSNSTTPEPPASAPPEYQASAPPEPRGPSPSSSGSGPGPSPSSSGSGRGPSPSCSGSVMGPSPSSSGSGQASSPPSPLRGPPPPKPPRQLSGSTVGSGGETGFTEITEADFLQMEEENRRISCDEKSQEDKVDSGSKPGLFSSLVKRFKREKVRPATLTDPANCKY